MEYNQNIPRGKPSTPVLCWGHRLLPPQKGVTTYRVSANRLMPLAHAGHNAVFNTARRMRQQFLYVVPPFVGAYWLSQWMDKRYHYLNSKAGMQEMRKQR